MTHFRLAERTASELLVRDVARLLCAGGAKVAIFATRLGALADELRKDGIEVADHPRIASFQPDVIHGQGNLEAIAAILGHPGVPAVFLTHGCGSWRERPPRHPRIHRYLGITHAARVWLSREQGVPLELVAALPQFVDTAQIGEARKPPVKPLAALYCDHLPEAGNEERLIRLACEELGMQLDTVSRLAGASSLLPKDLMARYDLVFASGKTVLEALAAGCGVIPVSHGSFGSLVTAGNLDQASATDFSARRGAKPESILVAELAAEIETWDWRELSPVAAKVRMRHSADAVAARLREIHEAVLAEAASRQSDCRSELPAVSDWLLELAGQHHQLDTGFLELQRRAGVLKTDRTRLDGETQSLLSQLELEKEKVRIARRFLQDGSLLHLRLKSKIEEGWREIDERDALTRLQPGRPGQKPSVDLSG